jgi:hypothetical protein
MIKDHPLQTTLPTGFHTWVQVLTDWGVCSAFPVTDPPQCIEDRPELVAPFVVEVSAAIRDRQLRRRALEVALLREKVTEPAYAHAGGTNYRELCVAMQAAQDRYMATYCRRRASRDEDAVVELSMLRGEMERRQSAFQAARRAHRPQVEAVRASTARAYWAARSARGIPDTFFADAPSCSAPARMQRIHPPWWGGFLARLQEVFSHGHPADGCLLDQLQQLRRAATKMKLSAVLADWHQEHADRWGLYAAIHYRMLAIRAARKAVQVSTWFETQAPGFLANEAVRRALHADLATRLAQADPWAIVHSIHSTGWGEHGPN